MAGRSSSPASVGMAAWWRQGVPDGSVHVYSLDPPGEVFRFPVEKLGGVWSDGCGRSRLARMEGMSRRVGTPVGVDGATGWFSPSGFARCRACVTAVSINPDGEVDCGRATIVVTPSACFRARGREFQRMYNQSQVNSLSHSGQDAAQSWRLRASTERRVCSNTPVVRNCCGYLTGMVPPPLR